MEARANATIKQVTARLYYIIIIQHRDKSGQAAKFADPRFIRARLLDYFVPVPVELVGKGLPRFLGMIKLIHSILNSLSNHI